MWNNIWPTWLTPVPSFSPDELFLQIVTAIASAWDATLVGHEEETFYAFGLYPSEDDLAIQSTASSEEGLRRVSMDAFSVGTPDERAVMMRWDDADWPYSCSVLEPFDRLNESLREIRSAQSNHLSSDLEKEEWERRLEMDVGPLTQEIVELYLQALEQLAAAGTFNQRGRRVALGIFGPDVDRVPLTIQRLNPPELAATVLREMDEANRLAESLNAF